jgi:hypothetical protein
MFDVPPEKHRKRLEAELNELLQELRVVLPGIQVLFAFLLAVPFSQRFHELTETQRTIFFGAFLATAIASILLLAPGVQHRIEWRRLDKERLLRSSNLLAVVGTAVMAVAIDASVYLVADLVYGTAEATASVLVVGGAVTVVWWVSPIVRLWRHRRGGRTFDDDGEKAGDADEHELTRD